MLVVTTRKSTKNSGGNPSVGVRGRINLRRLFHWNRETSRLVGLYFGRNEVRGFGGRGSGPGVPRPSRLRRGIRGRQTRLAGGPAFPPSGARSPRPGHHVGPAGSLVVRVPAGNPSAGGELLSFAARTGVSTAGLRGPTRPSGAFAARATRAPRPHPRRSAPVVPALCSNFASGEREKRTQNHLLLFSH